MEIESWQTFVGGFRLALEGNVKRKDLQKNACGLEELQPLRVWLCGGSMGKARTGSDVNRGPRVLYCGLERALRRSWS